MFTNTPSPFLRRVLLADAIISGATGLLLFLGAGLLSGLLQLPAELLRPAGLFLIPYGALVAFIATRNAMARLAVWLIIVVNALWAVDSIVLLLTGWVAPNTLGYAFIVFQALVVAAFAELQFTGLRQQVKAAL